MPSKRDGLFDARTVHCPELGSITSAIGHSQVNTGWTVGAGLEGASFANWTLKAEYLYVDLGSLDDPDSVFELFSVTGGQTITHTHFTDNIFRVGLELSIPLI
ncbi:MAG: outer membrane protein [Betaproteobacteria bacterium]